MPRALTHLLYLSTRGVPVFCLQKPTHIASVLVWLTFEPGQIINRSSNWRMSSAHSILGTNRVRSSAYCTSLNSSCPIIMPWISCLLRIVNAIISAAIINKYGDDGSPCLTPLCNSQYGVQIRLFNTQHSYVVIMFLPILWEWAQTQKHLSILT